MKPIGVQNPVVFSYPCEADMEGTSAERKLIGRVAELKFSVVALGAYLRAVRTLLEKSCSLAV